MKFPIQQFSIVRNKQRVERERASSMYSTVTKNHKKSNVFERTERRYFIVVYFRSSVFCCIQKFQAKLSWVGVYISNIKTLDFASSFQFLVDDDAATAAADVDDGMP